MTTHSPKSARPDNRPARPGRRADTTRAKPGSSAQASYERYLALARAKAHAGDRVEAERYYQHAEHYHRLIHGTAA